MTKEVLSRGILNFLQHVDDSDNCSQSIEDLISYERLLLSILIIKTLHFFIVTPLRETESNSS